MPALPWTLTPSTQTVGVGVDATLTDTWSDGSAQGFGYDDGGGGGIFNPAADPAATSPRSFLYQNATPGTYTITVSALTGSLFPLTRTATVVVASATYTCIDTSTMLPTTFAAGDFSHKLTFPLPAMATGKWWGGTLHLKFSIDTAFPPFTPPRSHYLSIDVQHADNAANIGAFYMETVSDPILRFPVADNTTSFDETVTITDQFLDACTFGASGNLVVTIGSSTLFTISGHTINIRNVTITQATLCLRNVAEDAIAGSDLPPVAVVQSCPSPCNSNNVQTAAGAFSSVALSGVKYQVVSGAAVDLFDLWAYINKPADVATYETDGVLIAVTVTVPVPPNFMPFPWVACKINLKGTYTPDHTFGELQTTNDYPLYRFMLRGTSAVLDGTGIFHYGATGESDTFDGRYASDFTTDGIDVYFCPGAGGVSSTPWSESINGRLGASYTFYMMARHLATDGVHTGDALLEWGSFNFTGATFTFTYCNVGSYGAYDPTKTADFGPVFSSLLPAPTDAIGPLVAHFVYSSVVWESVPAGLPDQDLPVESWVASPQNSTVYPGYHTYRLNAGASDTTGHSIQFPWGNRPAAVIVGGTLYNWVLKTAMISGLTESYCGCTGPVLNPFNLQDEIGRYHEVGLSGKAVAYRRSNFGSNADVGWDAQSQIPAPPGRALFDPHLDFDNRQTVVIVYAQQVVAGGAWDGAYLVRSDDDGTTWNGAILAIASGKHPTVAIGHGDATFERVVVAAYVGAGGGPGVITAKYQDAGDPVLSDAFNFKDDGGSDLVVADDTFHIQQAHDNQARWMLHVRINGEAATSTWTSMDDCITFKRVV